VNFTVKRSNTSTLKLSLKINSIVRHITMLLTGWLAKQPFYL